MCIKGCALPVHHVDRYLGHVCRNHHATVVAREIGVRDMRKRCERDKYRGGTYMR